VQVGDQDRNDRLSTRLAIRKIESPYRGHGRIRCIAVNVLVAWRSDVLYCGSSSRTNRTTPALKGLGSIDSQIVAHTSLGCLNNAICSMGKYAN